ncbi:MAG TPA: hypothetical protein VHO71_02305 [Caproiciproducens sp.]|nr:hypothetical protein [Caproiciproducens sp.]
MIPKEDLDFLLQESNESEKNSSKGCFKIAPAGANKFLRIESTWNEI